MSWFSEKVTKEEFNELKERVEELEGYLKQVRKAGRTKVKKVKNNPKRSVKRKRYKWNFTFTPEELIDEILNRLFYDQLDITYIENLAVFKHKDMTSIIAAYHDDGIFINMKYVISLLKDLTLGEFDANRMPNGSVKHMSQTGFLKVHSHDSPQIVYEHFGENISGVVINNEALDLFKEKSHC